MNIIYEKFKGTPGLNITPRYNAKVTDLIYIAQGDGDDKETYPEYFEQPNMVYYNPGKIPPTKPNEDHYLRFPGIEKPIKAIN